MGFSEKDMVRPSLPPRRPNAPINFQARVFLDEVAAAPSTPTSGKKRSAAQKPGERKSGYHKKGEVRTSGARTVNADNVRCSVCLFFLARKK